VQIEKNDTIGVVRSHRWVSADVQRKRLQAEGVRIIVELDGKNAVERTAFERLVRQGTVVKFVHVFLLADPKAAHKKGGMFADFLAAMKRLVCKHPNGREGVLVDLETGLTTGDTVKKRALMVHVKDQLGRIAKGSKSAINGRMNTDKGRRALEFTDAELRDAKAVWRNRVEYPEWEDAEDGLKAVHPKFTRWRAHKMWGPRQPKRK
jgi:hypothetical protein